jgi:hypothetical protein
MGWAVMAFGVSSACFLTGAPLWGAACCLAGVVFAGEALMRLDSAEHDEGD